GDRLGWYLPQGLDALAEQSRMWMESDKGQAAVDSMEQAYYAYIDEFDFVDLRELNRRIEERLPTYIDHFLQAEQATGMPADLLAALAYQESHWDPRAESPTGVRGMMMLTRNTAESLGVDDRLDPAASIEAGARYSPQIQHRPPRYGTMARLPSYGESAYAPPLPQWQWNKTHQMNTSSTTQTTHAATEQFDAALARLAKDRKANPAASNTEVLEAARVLMTTTGGLDALYARVASLARPAPVATIRGWWFTTSD
ncbi:transglycosylase SLT domain-containing protein, partial [Halomonas sp.]|uniref:transglycosylase SLT domain-containing protein n=1 Tax=Halomonas sp. TaxID=1486246 RepID=UPI003565170E